MAGFNPSRRACNVRFTPNSGHVRCKKGCPLYPKSGHLQRKKRCPLCAKSELMHRSKMDRYSITSPAVASSLAGISIPSALAVLRLIVSSYFVGACTGMSAGFSPLRIRST